MKIYNSEISTLRIPVLLVAAMTANAQFVQQGGKLVGAGAIGIALQGGAVAISGDGSTILVGGVLDNNGCGAAWVYVRSASGWKQQAKLVRPTGIRDYFGAEVALSEDGNLAVVSSPYSNSDRGAVWTFTRNGTSWMPDAGSLTPDDLAPPSRFGGSIALSADGQTLAVGGPFDRNSVGAVWIFTRTSGAWIQQGPKLGGIDAAGAPLQGVSVSISGDGNTLLFGGLDDANAAGAAWVFTRSAGAWKRQGPKLVGAGAEGDFSWQGSEVALASDGNAALIAGQHDNYSAGAVWVFTRVGGSWTQQGGKLVGAGAEGRAYQGSVALSGDGSVAVIGGPGDHFPPQTGATWVFNRSGSEWRQHGDKLVGWGSMGQTYQGISVAIDKVGKTLVVGGRYDDGGTGAAWVFSSDPVVNNRPNIIGVTNAAGFLPGRIASGSWVSIFGSGLARTSRPWNEAEIVGGKLPTELDETSVTINGKPASVAFISPTQINVLSPDDPTRGPVEVAVNTATGPANSATVIYDRFAPGLFTAAPPYLVAQHADWTLVTPDAPARGGEVITIWGTGFGPATPPVPAGRVFSGASPLADRAYVFFDDAWTTVEYAGVVGAGLVQLNVRVPATGSRRDAHVTVRIVDGNNYMATSNVVPIRD
jgi:uncharacterized protein (TIGR03437 family)